MTISLSSNYQPAHRIPTIAVSSDRTPRTKNGSDNGGFSGFSGCNPRLLLLTIHFPRKALGAAAVEGRHAIKLSEAIRFTPPLVRPSVVDDDLRTECIENEKPNTV